MSGQHLKCVTTLFSLAILGTSLARGGEKPELRTWTDSTGQHETRATFIQFRDAKVYLEKEDGNLVRVPFQSLSTADQQYVRSLVEKKPSPLPPAEPSEGGSDVMEVDLTGDDKAAADHDDSAVREAVVTGVGLDPEKALQAAFTQAIEQTVGVLVDSETLIENDQIIRDKVLTFSRAYVREFDVLKQWEEGGLHKANIRATVSLTELAEKLKASNIAVKEVPGLKMKLEVKHELASEADAAEMFAKAMEQYGMDQLWTVQIDGKPEVVSKDATHAKLAVKARLVPNKRGWDGQVRVLRPLLERIASKKSACTCTTARYPYYIPYVAKPTTEEIVKRLGGDSEVIALMTDMNRSITSTEWMFYRVPGSLMPVLEDVRARKWELVLVLADEDGAVLAREERDLSLGLGVTYPWHRLVSAPFCVFVDNKTGGRVNAEVLSPLLWVAGAGYFYPSQDVPFEIEVPLTEFDHVTKCAVSLEKITKE